MKKPVAIERCVGVISDTHGPIRAKAYPEIIEIAV